MAKARAETRVVQREMNAFIRKHRGLDLVPLIVDGRKGTMTKRTIVHLKWLTGFSPKHLKSKKRYWLTAEFRFLLHHPNVVKPVDSKWSSEHPKLAQKKIHWRKVRIRRGRKRRAVRRKWVAREKTHAFFRSGVAFFDGKPVAKWIIPKLKWARANGWRGVVASGWRSIPYSIHLCMMMCGAPFCRGRCAGAGTNHVHSDPLPPPVNGAVDVTDYIKFGQLMARSDCPGPTLRNDLPIDRVHFSPSGH